MRILYVTHRYAHGISGGAEKCCMDYATRLAGRGHQVEVLTSCATNYVDWADELPEGSQDLDGVLVHRLPVVAPRDPFLFGALNIRITIAGTAMPLYMQRAWMHAQGPLLAGEAEWLLANASNYDVIIFLPYLYHSTWLGLRAAAGLTPTILHPMAHDEAPFALPIFDETFRLPTAIAYLTEEEGELVNRRFRPRQPSTVTGMGIDIAPAEAIANDRTRSVEAMRIQARVGDRPYLLFVGRVDPHKGCVELYDFFTNYKLRHPGPLALVVVGDSVTRFPDHADIFEMGFVEEETKHAAIAGCEALIQPSYLESFSIVLVEAWIHRRPALVQSRCSVLRGQARRSGGAIPYAGFGEFEAALEMLLADPELAGRLGSAGRRYVEDRYEWEGVLDRYEAFIEKARETHGEWVASLSP